VIIARESDRVHFRVVSPDAGFTFGPPKTSPASICAEWNAEPASSIGSAWCRSSR
jgi:hypothetical protein